MKDNSTQIESKTKLFSYYEKYMFVVGTLGQLLFYIQGAKIFIDRAAKDVSLPAFVLGLVSVSSWLFYGILIKNKALIVANICAVIGALFVIIGILIYSS